MLLFLGTYADIEYITRLKGLVGTAQVYVLTAPISTWIEVELYCKKREITGIFSTSEVLLAKLLPQDTKKGSIDNYAGSILKRADIEILFINPLKQLLSVTYGAFLLKRYLSKLIAPQDWLPAFTFSWILLSAENWSSIFSLYKDAIAVAVDIETRSSPPTIRCIGYTAILQDGTTHSSVLPMDSSENLTIMRKFNWELQAPKIFQNGKYDIAYLSMYDAVPYNYLWDTATMFHAWYSELPKDLAFLTGFFVRESMYWKDLAQTNDVMEYYKYNALDTWGTAMVFIAWLLEAPQWAKDNYVLEFPLLFPCHLAEMTGVKRDMEKLEIARKQLVENIGRDTKSLEVMTSTPGINTNSPKQVKQLLQILGCKDVASTDEIELKKYALLHPINARILGKILDIRGHRKLVSTYLRTDEDITKVSKRGGKEYKGRILYSLNPHGTDTGRLASREHHFWCGLQIQNIPRGDVVKQTIVADDGFLFGECDLEQAETRDTAYASGDANLIAAVSSGRDFHSQNAAAFFGVPYEQIYDDSKKKTVSVEAKELRDLAKRVNHGATYLMGPDVLIDTMGWELLWRAQSLLKLPKLWTLRQVATHLLAQFHNTYSTLKSIYYPSVVYSVLSSSKLVGATGWTRYCFGQPDKNKRHMNAYVAHVSQSLNAMILNKAWKAAFYEISIHPKYRDHFKLCAQIHDSILFQYRIGHEYLAEKVKKLMEIPVTIKGADGVTRTFTVPAALKIGGKYWSDLG